MAAWLIACVGSVLAGLVVHALLQLAARAWPVLLARRAVWLAAQAVIVGAALLPCLPRLELAGMAPAWRLSSYPAPAAAPALYPTAPVDARFTTAAAAATVANASTAGAESTGMARSTTPITPITAVETARPLSLPALATLLPPLWAAIYFAGLAVAARRLLRARRLCRHLLACASRLSPQQLATHGAFDTRQLDAIARQRLVVMETDAAVSPMLLGAWRPVLLLPRHLRGFSAEQQQMIVAHELHHWRARDPLWLAMSATVRTLFWFNPAARWLHAKAAWALELTCDQRVLAGRPQQQRKQYAASLLAQWKVQMTVAPATGAHFHAGLSFAASGPETVAARIRHMQHVAWPALPAAAAWTVAATMAGVLTAGALLQPALAVDATPALPAMTTPPTPAASSLPSVPSMPGLPGLQASAATAAPAAPPWRHPLDRMRVSGFFGVQREFSAHPHPGVDLAAPRGTPVHAAAAGTVIAAGALAENDGRYGNTVVVDTGAGLALYAHLDSVAVHPGDAVAAGQVLGAVGSTGFATGPHLHFELRRDGQAVDPAIVLAGLDAHATRRALKVRRAQLGR